MRAGTGSASAVVAAACMFVAWTAATWFFEGRIDTMRRPDAVADRLVYALAVNLLLGVAGSFALLAGLLRRGVGALRPERCGFGSATRTVAATAIGFALGAAAYVAQGAPSTDPVVVANAFAQVFVVSAAEVVVCWALAGAAIEAALAPRVGRAATTLAALAAALLFGLYHFAHSAPFDTWPMVALLSAVGLVTGLFFFVSRDLVGTVVFHNFLGTFGVSRALVDAGAVGALETIQAPLLGTALVTMLMLLAGRAWLLRREGAHAMRVPARGES